MDSYGNSGISIQVSLSGYSFKLKGEDAQKRKWLAPGSIFTVKEFQAAYDEVAISLMTPKVALVPEAFFDASAAREELSRVVSLAPDDEVDSVAVPQFQARLLYSLSIGERMSGSIAGMVRTKSGKSTEVLPEMYFILRDISSLEEYNRIVASYSDGHLYLAIGQGDSLLMANVFDAVDFTTAEYFIFLALKKLQINPEASSIHFRTPLASDEEMSLYRYFGSVEM